MTSRSRAPLRTTPFPLPISFFQPAAARAEALCWQRLHSARGVGSRSRPPTTLGASGVDLGLWPWTPPNDACESPCWCCCCCCCSKLCARQRSQAPGVTSSRAAHQPSSSASRTAQHHGQRRQVRASACVVLFSSSFFSACSSSRSPGSPLLCVHRAGRTGLATATATATAIVIGTATAGSFAGVWGEAPCLCVRAQQSAKHAATPCVLMLDAGAAGAPAAAAARAAARARARPGTGASASASRCSTWAGRLAAWCLALERRPPQSLASALRQPQSLASPRRPQALGDSRAPSQVRSAAAFPAAGPSSSP